MLSTSVRDNLRAVPFVPFLIRMNDGRGFAVPHPDFAHVSPQGSSVIVYSDEEGAMSLSSILIAAIEPLPAKRARGKKTRK